MPAHHHHLLPTHSVRRAPSEVIPATSPVFLLLPCWTPSHSHRWNLGHSPFYWTQSWADLVPAPQSAEISGTFAPGTCRCEMPQRHPEEHKGKEWERARDPTPELSLSLPRSGLQQKILLPLSIFVSPVDWSLAQGSWKGFKSPDFIKASGQGW